MGEAPPAAGPSHQHTEDEALSAQREHEGHSGAQKRRKRDDEDGDEDDSTVQKQRRIGEEGDVGEGGQELPEDDGILAKAMRGRRMLEDDEMNVSSCHGLLRSCRTHIMYRALRILHH